MAWSHNCPRCGRACACSSSGCNHRCPPIRQPHNAGCDEALVEAHERADMLEQENAALRKRVDSQQAEINTLVVELGVERKRVEELEGEARVLIGCPCLCHTGQYGEPHLDCRECVRGCATPSAIDHDHEWALWCEKWRAALDLVGNAQARAEQAERERASLQNVVDYITMRFYQIFGRPAGEAPEMMDSVKALQADLDAALLVIEDLCPAERWVSLRADKGGRILALLEKRREARRG